MDVVIVYESMFGNTHAVAEAVAVGIADTDPAAHVTVVPVGDAAAGDVAGAGFTHEPAAEGPGIRDWLGSLPQASPGQLAAAFDTRVDVRFAGAAAKEIAKRLRHRGYRLAAPPEGSSSPAPKGRCVMAGWPGPGNGGRGWCASRLTPESGRPTIRPRP
jgi:flavodoxin